MMAGWAEKGILNSPGYLVRKENHGSDFAEATTDRSTRMNTDGNWK
jgi:hypothetical protein